MGLCLKPIMQAIFKGPMEQTHLTNRHNHGMVCIVPTSLEGTHAGYSSVLPSPRQPYLPNTISIQNLNSRITPGLIKTKDLQFDVSITMDDLIHSSIRIQDNLNLPFIDLTLPHCFHRSCLSSSTSQRSMSKFRSFSRKYQTILCCYESRYEYLSGSSQTF